eukprot:TRINITY_DN1423_c0_g1_i1.p1 TRINITY_DN1423_c0_g1~~TRINITY_DN1423_c0_g1_i1.p1  ORF type:complete len:212 (+),score=61.10 TRINITY_DN1423_c0_g1_i1:132-767(+)
MASTMFKYLSLAALLSVAAATEASTEMEKHHRHHSHHKLKNFHAEWAKNHKKDLVKATKVSAAAPAPASAAGPASAPGSAPGGSDAPPVVKTTPPPALEVDTDLPYGELAPFGRESTAMELTEKSMLETNKMIDTIEKAEVAEEKRSVFRALTRLRGAAITSFDGVAKDQTANIDTYSKQNKWREDHPVKHLADEEADVQSWAFPSNADFL